MAKKQPPASRTNTGNAGNSGRTERKPAAQSLTFAMNVRLQAIIVALFAFALYAPTLRYDYALDDKIVLSENKFVQQGIKGIPDILSRSTFDGQTAAEKEKNKLSGGRYRPLSLVMFAIEYEFSGGKPALHHFIHVTMYAGLMALLLYTLHLLMAGSAAGSLALKQFTLLPFVTVLFFAAQPIHSEVVANVKSRDEVLCLLLALAALYEFVKYCRATNGSANNSTNSGANEGAAKHLALCSVWFFLALFAKESAITFLAVFPLTAWFFAAAPSKQNDENNAFPLRTVLIGLVPVMVLAVAFLMIRTSIVGFIDSRSSPSIFDNPFLRSTTSERYATAVAMLGRYLVYTIFPLNLSHEYVYNELIPVGWTHWQTIVSLIVHLALVGFAVWKLRERHLLSYAILYYLATISIVSNIAFSIGALFGERFLFMPSVGSSLAYAWLLCWLLGVRPSEIAGKKSGSKQRVAWSAVLAATGVIVAAYSVRTIIRNPAWANEDTLLVADTEATPNSLRNRRVYAGFLLRDAKNATNPQQAERCLQLAYENLKYCINRDSTVDDKAFFNLGQYYGMFRSNVDSAVIHYRKAHQLRPDDSTNYVYYTFNVGNQHLNRKEYDTAIAIYKSVLHLGIEMETLNFNIGVALVGKELYAEALPWFEEALKVNPKNPAIPNAINICQQEIANRKLGVKQQ